MNTIRIPLEATSKELSFLSDPELADIVRHILIEIDDLVLVRAYRSMLYLSVSTLEGILSNVLQLNENKLKTFPNFPKNKKGESKSLHDLDLFEKISLANKPLDIIADEYYETFQKFRGFRNYMHPLIELEKKEPLDIGLGQVALGLMNHTISKLEKIRFIDEKIWRVVSGKPIYISSQEKIEFNIDNLRTNSFIVTEDYKNQDIDISFDLQIGNHAIFNFVYDYESEGQFRMFRFDTRVNETSGILYCEHKFGWRIIEEYRSTWNIKTREPNKIRFNITSNGLKTFLNDEELFLGQTISCDKAKSIGFFNEVEKVSVSNMTITL